MPLSSIFDVVINVDLKKALNNGLSVKSDSTALTFVTDESCFLFIVNTFFLCHNAIQTLPQQKKKMYLYMKKNHLSKEYLQKDLYKGNVPSLKEVMAQHYFNSPRLSVK